MSTHFFRIYYRKQNNELWTKIYEDNFNTANYLDNRNKVIEALEHEGFQYEIIDKFDGVVGETKNITETNTNSLFDGLQNYEYPETNVNVVLNYLNALKYFVKSDSIVNLDNLIFTNYTYDLIKVVQAYNKYTKETIFTQNEMDFFKKAVQHDYRLLVAYLFFEYMIDRIESGQFSRYANTETNDFFSIKTNRQISIHKNTVLSALVNSAVKLYRSNQISIGSKINLLQYSDFQHMVQLIKSFNYSDFVIYNNSPKDEYYEIFKEITLTDEEKAAIDFAMAEGFKIEKISNQNIDFRKNQNIDKILSKTGDKSVLSAAIKYNEQIKIIKRKKKILSVLIPIFVVIMIVMISIIANKINEARYTYTSVNSDNFNTYVVLNPSIIETRYFTESSILPSKYIYEVELNENYLTDYIIKPRLIIEYSTPDGTFERQLTTLSFETQKEIFNVIISVSSNFNEDLKILKSDLESLNVINNSIQEYILTVSRNSFHFEEVSLTTENYSSYISIIVNAPVDYLRNGLYRNTTYSISISKKNSSETILQANIVVRYDLSSVQYSSSSTPHTVTFTLNNQTKTDSFGRYPYYEDEIQSVTGKIIIRSSSPR